MTDIKEKGQLLLVHWEDHFSRSSWHDSSDIDMAPIVIESIGWLAAEDDKLLVLHNMITPGSCGHAMHILQTAVVGRWVISYD